MTSNYAQETQQFYEEEIDKLPTTRRKKNYLNKDLKELEYQLQHMKPFKYFHGEIVTPSQIVRVRVDIRIITQLLDKLNTQK